MKKTLITTFVLSVMFSGVSVFADSDVTIPSSPLFTFVGHTRESEENISLEKNPRLQYHGDSLIKERISALSSNVKVIAVDKTLTAEQKSALTTVLTTNINGLNVLKATLASSTDATSTRALVTTIFTNFRIYGIVIPQVRIEKRIYDLQNHSVKLSDTFIKVQAKIDEYKGKGRDVTVWQKSLDDAKILVANDMNTLASLMTTVSALKPSDYGTSSKATIEQVNSSMKSVLKDFNSIKKNVHKPALLVGSRKVIGTGTTTPSPLFGTSWTWVSSTVNGVITNAPTGGKFVVSFGEDNRVHSTTDCNGVGGSYTLGTNNTITFGPFMSTMMFCEGSREGEYSRQFTVTTAYKVDGSNLTLTNASGTMMFVKK